MEEESNSENSSDRNIADSESEDGAGAFSPDGTEDEYRPENEMNSDSELEEGENMEAESPNKPKTSTENKTDDVSKFEVRSWIEKGLLELRDPPKGKRLTARAWTEGIMKFLYWTETDDELEEWYACSKCDYLFGGKLGKGTKGMKDHCDIKHPVETGVYQFDKKQLASALFSAVMFGKNIGSISKEKLEESLPKPEKGYFE